MLSSNYCTARTTRMNLVLILLVIFLASNSAYEYETRIYKQQLDHFAFTNDITFAQRYLYNDSYWKAGEPIFFYAGNEGDIKMFAENTGFMWEIAPKFNALIIFAEHRYYGTSLPFGNDSFSGPERAGYLSSEQALADYAELLLHLKAVTLGAAKSPVIAFGGSYGGMLAAWFRIKYPHVIQGAIASSAPVLQFTGLTPCEVFGQITTRAYSMHTETCADTIRASWTAVHDMMDTEEGRQWLSEKWKLCSPLTSSQNYSRVKSWLENIWINLAMINYPYPANFLSPLPGHPVKEVCNFFTNVDVSQQQLLQTLFQGLQLYFNYTGNTQCLNIGQDATTDLGERGWAYQSCTEMVMPMCYDGVKDFFSPTPWNLTAYSLGCQRKFGFLPRPFMAPLIYGGRELSAASNIIFSNGGLDPWSGGGVLQTVSDSVVAISIPEGAHHLDLRSSNPADPPSVTQARQTEMSFIEVWITQYKRRAVANDGDIEVTVV